MKKLKYISIMVESAEELNEILEILKESNHVYKWSTGEDLYKYNPLSIQPIEILKFINIFGNLKLTHTKRPIYEGNIITLEQLRNLANPKIDLTKSQVFDEFVKCWVKDQDHDEWQNVRLSNIDHKLEFPYRDEVGEGWEECTLENPNKPKERYMTRDEVLGFVSNNAKGMLVMLDSDLRRSMLRTPPLWIPATSESFVNEIKNYEYKIVNEKGETIQKPRRFVVKEEK